MKGESPAGATEADKTCKLCGREERYCVCQFVTPFESRTKVVLLQHPQEPGVDIGTASIIRALLPNCVVRTGLSWPNLTKVLGYESTPQRWGVLYLGSVQVEQLDKGRDLFVVDKKGLPVVEQDSVLRNLEGIILLDGTWSQAKTLWWRNAWLLKLKRLVLRPSHRSLYDQIRKEPRRGCLSTLETVGEVLRIIEDRPEIAPLVERPLSELVSRLSKNRPGGPPRNHQNRSHRRRRR